MSSLVLPRRKISVSIRVCRMSKFVHIHKHLPAWVDRQIFLSKEMGSRAIPFLSPLLQQTLFSLISRLIPNFIKSLSNKYKVGWQKWIIILQLEFWHQCHVGSFSYISLKDKKPYPVPG